MRQQDRELIAAKPANDIRVAQPLLQKQRQSGEQVISRPVSAAVVDILELIEVEKEQRPARPIALRFQ